MKPTRHIAAVPTEQEQRCLRCCEVISSRKKSRMPSWPGSYVVIVGDLAFPNHPVAIDCVGVDLNQEVPSEADRLDAVPQ